MNKYTETSDKISNHHQLGGIETSVLDNGKGKGTRIAWVNTGSGFRYKVVLDRCMDIADAFFGKHLEMKRTITSVLGEASLTIRDEIINKSNSPLPLMLMYHCNFGYPLDDTGARLCWDGKWMPRSESLSDTYIFNNTNDFKKCREPLDTTEEFNGEACAFISPAADSAGVCRASIINEKINVAVELLFDKQELPYLTNWQHYKRGEYVIGLEPGTNPPVGQSSAKAGSELVYLKPNETKTFNFKIVLHDNTNL